MDPFSIELMTSQIKLPGLNISAAHEKRKFKNGPKGISGVLYLKRTGTFPAPHMPGASSTVASAVGAQKVALLFTYMRVREDGNPSKEGIREDRGRGIAGVRQ